MFFSRSSGIYVLNEEDKKTTIARWEDGDVLLLVVVLLLSPFSLPLPAAGSFSVPA